MKPSTNNIAIRPVPKRLELNLKSRALAGLLVAISIALAHPPSALAAETASGETLSEVTCAPYLHDLMINARDTLDPGQESNADAQKCLDGLCWTPTQFEIKLGPPANQEHDVLVRFPSAVPSGDALNDQAAMEWFVATDEQGRPKRSRAVVVVHESGSNMKVGRLFAQGIRRQGLHAVMLQLPYYGERRKPGTARDHTRLFATLRQAIADVRRARDVVAALPLVDDSHIALQGTSLGGFVSATSAGLDDAYDSVYLMLAGGDLYDLIQNGEKDAAKVRKELSDAGFVGERLRSLIWTIEPTRLAHRLNRDRTWLFSGAYDRVVPPKNAVALAKSARLDEEHHLKLLANHYTGIVYMPFVLDHIRRHTTAPAK